MAVTKFSDLYPYLRTFLNDLNPIFSEFSEKELDGFIFTYVALAGSPVRDGKKMQFTTEIAIVQDQALLSAKVAVFALTHQDTFRFGTKIYNIGDGLKDLLRRIADLQDRISEIENDDDSDGLAVTSDGDWRAVFGIQAKENTRKDIEADWAGA